jgi:O-antigen/teichoic acid export membrane protein
MFTNNVPHRIGVQSLFLNAGFLVLSTILEKAIRFIYLIVLARWLGPEMLGLYNYGLAWYLIFMPLALWGLGTLLSIHLGKKPENAGDVVAATFLLRTFTTIIAASCCLVIGLLSNHDLMSRDVITIFVIALVGRSLALWGRDCFVGVELSQYSAGLEIGFRFVEVCCGIVYLSFGGGIIGLCAIHYACWVAEGMVAFALVRKRHRSRKIFMPWSFVRPYAVKAFPIAVNAFLVGALFQVGFVVLKYLSMDARALGYYAVAFQLVANTIVIPLAFGRAALPILSRAHSRGTGESIVFLEAMLKICSFCSAVLVMFVIVYDTYILRLLFGQKYLMASDALVICAIAMTTWYALPLANNVLNAGAEYLLAAVNVGIALIANIGVTVWLVPSMAEKAPAFGLLVGASVALMLHLIVIHRKIDKISWWHAVIKPYVSVILAVTVAWNLKQFGGLGLGAGLVILGACYAGLRMFTPQEVCYFAKLVPWLQRS